VTVRATHHDMPHPAVAGAQLFVEELNPIDGASVLV
jgi:hypothetical protein